MAERLEEENSFTDDRLTFVDTREALVEEESENGVVELSPNPSWKRERPFAELACIFGLAVPWLRMIYEADFST